MNESMFPLMMNQIKFSAKTVLLKFCLTKFKLSSWMVDMEENIEDFM